MTTRAARAAPFAVDGRGFTTIELLIAISLFTALGLVAAYAFTGTMRLSHQTTSAQDTLARSERLLDALRRDVWSAAIIETSEPSQVRLTDGAGDVVAWAWDGQTLTRQSGEDAPQHWPEAVQSAAFTNEGPVLVATLTDPAGDATIFRFPSQLRLARQEAR
jgi:type II secretory pathway component PulJ